VWRTGGDRSSTPTSSATS